MKEHAPDDKEALAGSVFHTLSNFIAFTLYQADKEEAALLLRLWRHFSDAEIMGMEQPAAALIQPPVLTNENCCADYSCLQQETKERACITKTGVLHFCI